MPKYILADDFTGANGIAATLATKGIRVAAVNQRGGRLPAGPAMVEFLAVNTGLRNVDPQQSYAVMRSLLRDVPQADVVSIRIDSTLRGPISSLLQAVRDAYPDAMLLFCAANPALGRITKQGVHYVHGRPVAETAAKDDMLAPVTTSFLPDLFSDHDSNSVSHCSLSDIELGHAALSASWRGEYQTGRRLFLCDAQSESDLRELAIAANMAATALPVIVVDSSALTQCCLAQARAFHIQVISGSQTELTRQQLDHLSRISEVHWAGWIGDFGLAQPQSAAKYTVSGLRSADLFRARASPDEVAALLAQHARAGVEQNGVDALVVSGGEVCRAVLDALQAEYVEIVAEIHPLIALGEIHGGCADGVLLVTKGGLVGNIEIFASVIDKLCLALEVRSFWRSERSLLPQGIRQVLGQRLP